MDEENEVTEIKDTIVSMIEFKGLLYVATRHSLYASFDGRNFNKAGFVETVEEKTE